MSPVHRIPFARLLRLSLTLVIAGPGFSQIQQAVPFGHTRDAIVIDNAANQLWRFMDLNLDGDWNDAGEIVPYLTSTLALPLSNPTNVAVGPDGVVYVADSTTDQIIRIQDLDGDGLGTTPGEGTVFFSAAGNASGVTMPSALGLTVSADGAVWVANSNSSTGTDSVIRLADGNGNVDAQDAGEAVEYARFAVGQSTGVSIPSNVVVGADGAVYYLENGTAGKGIYRLHDDLVPNGVCTDAGEVTAFYLPAPPAPTPTAQYWGLAADKSGNLWIAETAFDRILRVADLDSDLVIANGSTEEAVFFAATAPSNMWTAAAGSDGALYVVEDASSTTPDRIYRLADLGSNGTATDPGESQIVYDDSIASVNLGSIRSIAFLEAPYLAVTPNPVPIGVGATFAARAGANEFMNVWVSLLPDFLPVPPFGDVGISIAPGVLVELIPAFTLNATGTLAFFFHVANDPILIGATFYLQAIGGPAGRLQLSNVAVVTFM
jgi:hypothetical protein